jgi:putative ABC transport system permease protein
MSIVWQDIRYAFRMLAKSPGFTLVALLTMAIGIGANTAIFTLVDSILLRPLPYSQPEQLVHISDVQPPHEIISSADFPEFTDWRGQKQVFSDVAAYLQSPFDLTGQGDPERFTGIRVSANYFPMLGIQPAIGRGFTPEEETRSGERVCLISDGLWKRKFAGDPGMLGRKLTLSDYPYTIIGVLSPKTKIPNDADIVAGLRLDPSVAPRGFHFLQVIARLRPGISLDQARKEIEPFAAALQKERSIDHGMSLSSLKEEMTRGAGTPLLVMLGAVGFVLLIACANVANLLLARAQNRRREIAIRAALGATRRRIVRQLLTESGVLAVAGAVLGLLVSFWLTSLLLSSGLPNIPRSQEIHTDATVYAFAGLLALLTMIFFGLSPALITMRSSSAEVLKDGTRGAGIKSGRHRSILIASEIALSLVLLIGTGLLLRSFDQLLRVNKGFDPQNVLTFDLMLPPAHYPAAKQQAAFSHLLSENLKSVPGIESAGTINQLVLGQDNVYGDVLIKGKTFPKGAGPMADKRVAGGDYFQVLHIPLLRGRYFDQRDVAGAPQVAVVNEAFARKYFPSEDPLGKHVDFQWDTTGWQEIVGVIGNVKHDALNRPSNPEIYVPFAQRPDASFTVTVRTHSDPVAMAGAVREQIAKADSNLPLAHLRTMEEVVSASIANQRFTLLLLGAFALLALGLTVIGLYGVIAYTVSLRTREIGIRLALGARPSDVLRMVVGEALRLVTVGAAAGLVAAFVLTRFMSTLLFNVKPADILTYASVTAILGVITLAASYAPARRATSVDALVALRYE